MHSETIAPLWLSVVGETLMKFPTLPWVPWTPSKLSSGGEGEILIVTEALVMPLEFVAVTIKELLIKTTVGVPLITQV